MCMMPNCMEIGLSAFSSLKFDFMKYAIFIIRILLFLVCVVSVKVLASLRAINATANIVTMFVYFFVIS